MLPFLAYWLVKRTLIARSRSDTILSRAEYRDYPILRPEQLDSRIAEEHDRAAKLDDKTFRLTFALSFGLAVLGVVGAITLEGDFATSGAVVWAMLALGSLSALYLWIAALLAAGALESEPSYGYGTGGLVDALTLDEAQMAARYAEDLARQETVNLSRHNRNNATYMCMRNALVLLIALGGLLLFTFVAQQLGMGAD